MVELLADQVQGAGLVGVGRVERADVQLVDHQLVLRRDDRLIVLPVEVSVVEDHPVADGVGDLAGVGVDLRQLAALERRQAEPVLVARLGLRRVAEPVAVPLVGQRSGTDAPVVPRPDHVDRVRMGRPHPEGDPLLLRQRTHALDVCRRAAQLLITTRPR